MSSSIHSGDEARGPISRENNGVHGDTSFHTVSSTDVRGGGGPITAIADPKVKSSSQNNCSCMKWVAGALLVVGIAATLFGILAIMGSSLPTVPFFQDVAAITSNIGAQLGTDAWTISILTTSLGAAMTIGGAFWAASIRWSSKEYARLEESAGTSPGIPDGGPLSEVAGRGASAAEESSDGSE